MTTATPQAMTDEERRQAEVFPQALAEIRQGHPRLFIERFLWIYDGDRRKYVQFKYVDTQRIFDETLFQPLRNITDPIMVNILKARQVKMSSICFAICFSSAVNYMGTEAIYTFQDERTGQTQEERLQTFEDRMPFWFWEHDGAKIVIEEKGKTFRRYGFYVLGTGGAWVRRGSSSINIVSAGSSTFGAGPKYNLAVFDEFDEYDSLRVVREVEAAMSKDVSWVFKVSNPRGRKQMWENYNATKTGRAGGENLVFYCFMNNSNRVKSGSIVAPPKYRYDFDLTHEHLAITKSSEWDDHSLFKGDEVFDFFRWYETEMQQTRQDLGHRGIHSEKRVQGEFFSQHMVDDRRCWKQYGKSPFDDDRVDEDIERARDNPPKTIERVGENAELRIWVPRQPKMAYAFALDPALGLPTSDATAGGMWDADGNLCATLYGRGDLGIITRRIVQLCKEYNDALLVPEVDGKLGLFVIEEARREGHTNFWYVPIKPGENPDSYAKTRWGKVGWRTQGNKEAMGQNGITRYNNGEFNIPDINLLTAMSNYDIESQRHTDDWLMMFFTGAYITHPDHRYGRQFQAMVAESGRTTVSATVKRLVEYELRRIGRQRQPTTPGSGVWGQRAR